MRDESAPEAWRRRPMGRVQWKERGGGGEGRSPAYGCDLLRLRAAERPQELLSDVLELLFGWLNVEERERRCVRWPGGGKGGARSDLRRCPLGLTKHQCVRFLSARTWSRASHQVGDGLEEHVVRLRHEDVLPRPAHPVSQNTSLVSCNTQGHIHLQGRCAKGVALGVRTFSGGGDCFIHCTKAYGRLSTTYLRRHKPLTQRDHSPSGGDSPRRGGPSQLGWLEVGVGVGVWGEGGGLTPWWACPWAGGWPRRSGSRP